MRDQWGEVACTLGGEWVTQYSGARPPATPAPSSDPLTPDTMLASAGSALLRNFGFKPVEPAGGIK